VIAARTERDTRPFLDTDKFINYLIEGFQFSTHRKIATTIVIYAYNDAGRVRECRVLF